MDHDAPLNELTLRTVPAETGAIWQSTAVYPWIDGRDVLATFHPDGVSSCFQDKWLGAAETWPLWAADEPRRVELSNNECVTSCCGGMFVTVRRRGDRVEWTDWANTGDDRAPLPPEAHFDAARYDAELARAAAECRGGNVPHRGARLG